jgi:hypothetical protein
MTTHNRGARRVATSPVKGGLRDGVAAVIAAFVASLVTQKTGDPETGAVAGEAASQIGGEVWTVVFGGLMGFLTMARKAVSERFGNPLE